jgi:CDP-glucose 4,6-dehydratase
VRVLITGHTGFKGSWLSLYLKKTGHEVSGIALDPIPNGIFDLVGIQDVISQDFRVDIRDADKVFNAVQSIKPDVIFHLAAQPLVIESYKNPRYTIETNVMGTLNLLESAASTDGVKAMLAITTDKVYRNVNQVAGYFENDPLGGDDIYSSSKAMTDLMVQSWDKSFSGPKFVTVRGGNVIGGGDASPDRLLPDLIKAYESGQQPELRYPEAVRPWQHVLDCIHGYVKLSDFVMGGGQVNTLNIGPGINSFVNVIDVARLVQSLYGSSVEPAVIEAPMLHEASLLALNASEAERILGWKNKLDFRSSVTWTTNWHQALKEKQDIRKFTESQLDDFLKMA